MEIKIVPRFFINGVSYTMDQLPKEQVAKIVEERVDQAMSRINFERKKAAERRQAVKRNIIISVIIGTLATYLPFWQWDGLQVAGAMALSMLAWMLIQGTEPEGMRP